MEGSPLDAGKLVLSPTRTYAPIVKRILDAHRKEIHGMVRGGRVWEDGDGGVRPTKRTHPPTHTHTHPTHTTIP